MVQESSYKIRGTNVTSPYEPKLTPAETRLIYSLQKHFSPTNIFPDCYFLKTNFRTEQAYNPQNANFALGAVSDLPGSEYVQIDCLALNQAGLFVFESKDYSGWIYGTESQKYWTETLNFGQEKHRFYNPIKQNSLHITSVAPLVPDIPIFSIIVFGNEATFKTPFKTLPANCHICHQSQIHSILSQISAQSSRHLSDIAIQEISQIIQNNRIIPNTYIRNSHICTQA